MQNTQEKVYNLIIGAEDLEKQWHYVDLWSRENPENEEQRTKIILQLRKDISLIQELSIAINEGKINFNSAFENIKFQRALTRYQALQSLGLFTFLEKQKATLDIERNKKLSSEYLPNIELDVDSITHEQLLWQSRLLCVNLTESEEFYDFAELIDIMESVINETGNLNTKIDLFDLKHTLRKIQLKNKKSNAWHELCHLIQTHPNALLMMLGKPVTHRESFLLGTEGQKAYTKELQENQANFINIAIHNTMSLMYEIENESERKSSKDILQELYGEIGVNFDYEAEFVQLEIEIQELIKATLKQKDNKGKQLELTHGDQRLLKAGIKILNSRFVSKQKLILKMQGFNMQNFLEILQRIDDSSIGPKAILDKTKEKLRALESEAQKKLFDSTKKLCLEWKIFGNTVEYEDLGEEEEESEDYLEQKSDNILYPIWKRLNLDVSLAFKPRRRIIEFKVNEIQSIADLLRRLQFYNRNQSVLRLRDREIQNHQYSQSIREKKVGDFSELDLSGQDLIYLFLFNTYIVTGYENRINSHGLNFSKSNLAQCYLSRSQPTFINRAILFHGIDFTEADLIDARLYGIELENVNFTKANLTGADLSGCVLYRPNFSNANLTNANFRGAYLEEAILTEVKLEGADFTNTKISLPAKS